MAALLHPALLALAVGLALQAGCDADCEEPDEHAVDGGWLVMDNVSRTPGDLEDVPGLFAISASGDMQLAFSRGAPSEEGEFGDPPTSYPHTPTRFRYHGGDWCGPLDSQGGWIAAAGDTFYSVTASDDGDLLLSNGIGDTWSQPVRLEVPGMAVEGIIGLAGGPDTLAVLFFGAGGVFAARIDGDRVEEPGLVSADGADCLFEQFLVDADGHLHTVATCDRTGARILTYASDASGAWEAEPFPYRAPASNATISVGQDGIVHSAGSSCLVGTCQSYDEPVVVAYSRRVDGVWSAPVEAIGRFNTMNISNPGAAQIAVLDDGLIVLAFVEHHRSGWWEDDTSLLFSRDGESFGGLVTLQQAEGNHNVSLHRLAVDPATGLPVVLFRHYLPDNPSFSLGVAWPESAEVLP